MSRESRWWRFCCGFTYWLSKGLKQWLTLTFVPKSCTKRWFGLFLIWLSPCSSPRSTCSWCGQPAKVLPGLTGSSSDPKWWSWRHSLRCLQWSFLRRIFLLIRLRCRCRLRSLCSRCWFVLRENQTCSCQPWCTCCWCDYISSGCRETLDRSQIHSSCTCWLCCSCRRIILRGEAARYSLSSRGRGSQCLTRESTLVSSPSSKRLHLGLRLEKAWLLLLSISST